MILMILFIYLLKFLLEINYYYLFNIILFNYKLISIGILNQIQFKDQLLFYYNFMIIQMII